MMKSLLLIILLLPVGPVYGEGTVASMARVVDGDTLAFDQHLPPGQH